MLLVFAQTAVDPISGGAGWVGAGLLGLVLGWLLLVHLPNKDKQMKDYVTDKDTQLNTYISDKDKQMDKMLADAELSSIRQGNDFKEALVQITEHCAAEMKTVTEFWKRELDIMSGRVRQP